MIFSSPLKYEGSFLILIGLSVVAIMLLVLYMKETRGLTKEQIFELFHQQGIKDMRANKSRSIRYINLDKVIKVRRNSFLNKVHDKVLHRRKRSYSVDNTDVQRKLLKQRVIGKHIVRLRYA